MKNTENIFINFNLYNKIKGNFIDVLKKSNYQCQNLNVINVVGTNGKGTTSNILFNLFQLQNPYELYKWMQKENIQQNSKLKVGLFTSPSFLEHNERIKINNQQISDQKLNYYLMVVKNLCPSLDLNFFEIFTLIAIFYFIDEKVDLAIFEAGIGGSKDSTNFSCNQLAVFLTSISYDHQDLLGDNIESILENKIGILHSNCPIYTTYSNLQYLSKIKKIVPEKNKLNYPIKEFISTNDYFKNDALSSIQIFIDKNPWIKWKQDKCVTSILGRMSFFQKPKKIILDGAHNYDAIIKLFLNLNKNFSKHNFKIIYSSLYTKDYKKIINYLDKQHKDQYIITDFPNANCFDAKKISEDKQIKYIPFEQLKKWVNSQDDNLLVFCGSFYFISCIYKLLDLNF